MKINEKVIITTKPEAAGSKDRQSRERAPHRTGNESRRFNPNQEPNLDHHESHHDVAKTEITEAEPEIEIVEAEPEVEGRVDQTRKLTSEMSKSKKIKMKPEVIELKPEVIRKRKQTIIQPEVKRIKIQNREIKKTTGSRLIQPEMTKIRPEIEVKPIEKRTIVLPVQSKSATTTTTATGPT